MSEQEIAAETPHRNTPELTEAQRAARSAPSRRKALANLLTIASGTPGAAADLETVTELADYVDGLEAEAWIGEDEQVPSDEDMDRQISQRLAAQLERFLPLVASLKPQVTQARRALGLIGLRESAATAILASSAFSPSERSKSPEELAAQAWRLADLLIAAQPEEGGAA